MARADEEAAGNRWKKITLVLAALLLIGLVILMIWWSNLADPGIEEGPVEPMEAITDSADDAGGARPD